MSARAACVLVFALTALPCAAQLRPCAGASTELGHKLLVDDITGVQSGALTALEQRIDAALTRLQLETRAALPASAAKAFEVERVRTVRCLQRRPSGPAAFTEAMARELNNNEVVLEIWAETVPLPASEGPGFRAVVGYALVPLRHYQPRSLQGVITVERKTRSVDSPDDLLAVLDQSGTLAIYAAVGSGMRFFYAEEYDQARAQLCQAVIRLERLRGPSADDAELLRMVRTMSLDVVAKARANPAYTGDMRASDPGSCILKPL